MRAFLKCTLITDFSFSIFFFLVCNYTFTCYVQLAFTRVLINIVSASRSKGVKCLSSEIVDFYPNWKIEKPKHDFTQQILIIINSSVLSLLIFDFLFPQVYVWILKIKKLIMNEKKTVPSCLEHLNDRVVIY